MVSAIASHHELHAGHATLGSSQDHLLTLGLAISEAPTRLGSAAITFRNTILYPRKILDDKMVMIGKRERSVISFLKGSPFSA